MNDQILSAWLCFFFHQVHQDDYGGWPVSIPTKIREGWHERGWIEYEDGLGLGEDNHSIRVTDKGSARAHLDAMDWGINSIPEEDD